jgi:hypothetical protein
MTDDALPSGIVAQPDRLQRLGQGADLVEFDEAAVASLSFNSLSNAMRIGGQQVITDDLAAAAQARRQ